MSALVCRAAVSKVPQPGGRQQKVICSQFWRPAVQGARAVFLRPFSLVCGGRLLPVPACFPLPVLASSSYKDTVLSD